MSEKTLFQVPAPQAQPTRPPTQPREARVVRPKREQLQWAPVDLESLLSQDHAARAVWGVFGEVGPVGLLRVYQGGREPPWPSHN